MYTSTAGTPPTRRVRPQLQHRRVVRCTSRTVSRAGHTRCTPLLAQCTLPLSTRTVPALLPHCVVPAPFPTVLYTKQPLFYTQSSGCPPKAALLTKECGTGLEERLTTQRVWHGPRGELTTQRWFCTRRGLTTQRWFCTRRFNNPKGVATSRDIESNRCGLIPGYRK